SDLSIKSILHSRPRTGIWPVSITTQPEQFDNNRQLYPDFINQFHLLYMMSPQFHSTDRAKMSLVISRLFREALHCASSFLECNRPVLSNWEVFLQGMSVLFDDLHRA
uniref:DUF4939 domain-containing protein n=1 Tax=Terrapene triunguis TaxID=2587831 RepID=A0A674IZX0_9SAUR